EAGEVVPGVDGAGHDGPGQDGGEHPGSEALDGLVGRDGAEFAPAEGPPGEVGTDVPGGGADRQTEDHAGAVPEAEEQPAEAAEDPHVAEGEEGGGDPGGRAAARDGLEQVPQQGAEGDGGHDERVGGLPGVVGADDQPDGAGQGDDDGWTV